MIYVKNVIIGAGISGLAAARELNKSETVIYEKENYYGGLCNSFNVGDFVFDTAVHLSFTNNQIVKNIFEKVEYNVHKPVPFNYSSDKWLKYPIENNLFNLDTEEKINCVKSFIEKQDLNYMNDYRLWLNSMYGEYIAQNYYSKYTRKYWCKDAKELSTNWVAKRLNIPTIETVLRGLVCTDTGNDYYAKKMIYPIQGGYKSFLKPILDDVNIQLNKEVSKIDLKNKIIYFTDNDKCNYKNLISSIPLPEIIKLLDNVPHKVIEASKRLIATSIVLASVGFNKVDIPPHLWFYIYDEDILPARAYSPSIKSKTNSPPSYSSMQLELYYSKEKPLSISFENISAHIKDILIKMNICTLEDILFIDIKNIEYGNVIFYKGMELDRKIVKEYLESNGVNLIGRFGEWDYLWSDQSFMSGKSMGEKINEKK